MHSKQLHALKTPKVLFEWMRSVLESRFLKFVVDVEFFFREIPNFDVQRFDESSIFGRTFEVSDSLDTKKYLKLVHFREDDDLIGR